MNTYKNNLFENKYTDDQYKGQGRVLPTRSFYFCYYYYLFIFFFKSLLVACPTQTNPPGSGLGTGGIVFNKHIDKSRQKMNLKVHSYIFFTMRLAVNTTYLHLEALHEAQR